MSPVGPLGRLGHWTATNGRLVAVGWIVVALPLAALAPRVEHRALGCRLGGLRLGVGRRRPLVEREFDGLSSSSSLMVVVHSDTLRSPTPRFAHAVDAVGELLRGGR